jgi:hypothetical protein
MTRHLRFLIWTALGGVIATSACKDSGGPSADASAEQYTTWPDGHTFALVDYCLPVLPLSDSGRFCPSNADEAIAIASSGVDGGFNTTPRVYACAEPLIGYAPYLGRSCYYDRQSRLLVSVSVGKDTPSECADSPEHDTASFTYAVYGRFVACSPPDSKSLDASVDD